MKIMISIGGNFVASRFDLSPEVIIATCYDQKLLEEPRPVIVSNVSSEKLCDLALHENVDVVVCGGIEEQYYQFLTWKKIMVIDAVIGPYTKVLQLVIDGTLEPGAIVLSRRAKEGTP